MGGVKLEYLQPERHLHGESAPSGGVKPGSRRREPSGGCSIYRRERESRAAASRVSTVSTFKLHFSPFSTRQSVFGHSSGRVFMNVMYESKCQPRMTRARVSRERWGGKEAGTGARDIDGPLPTAEPQNTIIMTLVLSCPSKTAGPPRSASDLDGTRLPQNWSAGEPALATVPSIPQTHTRTHIHAHSVRDMRSRRERPEGRQGKKRT